MGLGASDADRAFLALAASAAASAAVLMPPDGERIYTSSFAPRRERRQGKIRARGAGLGA